MKSMKEYLCPICQSDELTDFFFLRNSPILQNVLYESETDAFAAEKVDVNFIYCSDCHFVFNPEFHESKVDYNEKYDNNQLASMRYREYIDELVDKLINSCTLNSKSRIMEIGCGNGYLLYRLHKRLENQNLVGYDPAYKGQYGMSDFIRKSYFQPIEEEDFDLIILRHVLEGLLNFDDVFKGIVSAMGDYGQLFVETPNLDYIISNKDSSLMYHEVARYYSAESLQRLFSKYALDIQEVHPLFNQNNIGVFAQKHIDVPSAVDISLQLEKLKKIVSQHSNVVIWGVSGRAISVLTNLSLDRQEVQYGVDIDVNKQGKYIPVTGQRIISPEQAAAVKPELVIVANANYLDEIRKTFKYKTNFLTVDGKFFEV